MIRFLVTRLWQGLFVIVGVLIVAFFLMRLTGDPTALFLPPGATDADFARLRHELGFDQPLFKQFTAFMADAVRGDLGTSLRHGEPALRLVTERLPATLKLTGLAIVISLVTAIPLGIVSALKRDTAWDTIASSVALAGQSMPTFWLGIVLMLLLAVKWRLLPTSGGSGFKSLILPSLTLGIYGMGLITRMVRSAVLEVFRKDYVRTARAKGLHERTVFVRHIIRNAWLPIVTIVGLQIANLLGGAIVTEQVFGYPGMARLAIQAVNNRDFPIVQAFVVITAILVLAVNFIVDLLYAKLDPRIVYG